MERALDGALSRLRALGIHGHKNHPKRTITGRFLEGEYFDFEVIAAGKTYCFDAKECAGNRWNLGNAKPRQVEALLQCAAHGAEAFFVVLFRGRGLKGLRRFDAQDVADALRNGKKSLTADEGKPWSWKELIS